MSELMLSNFCFHDALVRARVDERGNPWFVAKDVCMALGISNARDAVAQLDEDERATVGLTDTSSNGVTQTRTVNLISESGLYALIFKSRKPEARAFRKWVTAEVLPSLRKTGGYGLPVRHERSEAPAELPQFIVPDCAKHMRSGMRVKLIWSAVRAAEMDNSGGAGIARYFEAFCTLAGAVPASEENLLETFADEVLMEQAGARARASEIREALVKWWRRHGRGTTPGGRSLAAVLTARFERRLSNGVYYANCAFRQYTA